MEKQLPNDETNDLNKVVEICLKFLVQTKNYELVCAIGDIWEKRPKVYTVCDWPSVLVFKKESGEYVNLMDTINSLVAKLGCTLVIEQSF
jgi:hypothetical protein